METLEAYRERYRPVAVGAGLADEFDAAGPLEVVEDRVGHRLDRLLGHLLLACRASSTEPMNDDELERKIALLRACWAFFDGVARRGSRRRCARGRGRWAGPGPDHPPHHPHRERGLREADRPAHPRGGALAPGACATYREAYVAAMRAYNAGEVEKRCGRGRCRS